jgi:hypothetical protein
LKSPPNPGVKIGHQKQNNKNDHFYIRKNSDLVKGDGPRVEENRLHIEHHKKDSNGVKLNGKIVPFAEVEIEYFNQDGKALAPEEYMVTQTIKADANGVFSYATPKAGWWGFAALNEADYKIKQGNSKKSVELGAVLWVKFHEWKTKDN